MPPPLCYAFDLLTEGDLVRRSLLAFPRAGTGVFCDSPGKNLTFLAFFRIA